MITAKGTKKFMLILIGTISLIFGIVGILMPLLPTTPFLLLSSFCYLRSSKRLYNWLINHRILGNYIYNYLTYRAIKKSAKIGAIIFLWISLGLSIFIVESLYLKILLFAIGIGVSIHLLSLKSLK